MRGRPRIAAAIRGLATAGSRPAQPDRSDGVAPRRTLTLLPLLALAACATQSATAVAPDAPGFLYGVWHGFIFPVAWVISLFDGQAALYAVPNNGGWYDFGYFLGIVVFGVGARKSHVVYRDRNLIDVRAKRVEELGE